MGLGGKDGVYSVVDREDGSPVWERQVAEPGIPEPGANFSTGGLIGATAVADDLVVGGTAVGGDPYLHALDSTTAGLGPPERWLRPGSAAADGGAQRYGVYLSEGTDNPLGGLVCVLDDDFDCTGTDNPLPGARYDRLSILAVDEAGALPSLTEGFDRMVATNSRAVPFAP
jgi:hypothetical protein